MSDFDPGDFLKCPNCHRTVTVKLTLHTDGDVALRCLACDSFAMGHKLHESSRVYR